MPSPKQSTYREQMDAVDKAREDFTNGVISANELRVRLGLRPLKEMERVVKPLKGVRHWLREEVDVKMPRMIATGLVIGGITGWIICKLLP